MFFLKQNSLHSVAIYQGKQCTAPLNSALQCTALRCSDPSNVSINFCCQPYSAGSSSPVLLLSCTVLPSLLYTVLPLPPPSLSHFLMYQGEAAVMRRLLISEQSLAWSTLARGLAEF